MSSHIRKMNLRLERKEKEDLDDKVILPQWGALLLALESFFKSRIIILFTMEFINIIGYKLLIISASIWNFIQTHFFPLNPGWFVPHQSPASLHLWTWSFLPPVPAGFGFVKRLWSSCLKLLTENLPWAHWKRK